MNQKQSDNVKKILELADENVFDLSNTNVKKYVLEVIANSESEAIYILREWIKSKKINSIAEVVKCTPLLNKAWVNRVYEYDAYNEEYSIKSTFEFAVKTLEKYKDHPNIESVMQIIANFGWMKDYNKCKKLYFNLIAKNCFWLGNFDDDITTLIKLIEDNCACGNIIHSIEPSFKQKSFFKKMNAEKAYDTYYKSENMLNNYIDQLILKCTKIEDDNKKNNSIDEIKRMLKDK